LRGSGYSAACQLIYSPVRYSGCVTRSYVYVLRLPYFALRGSAFCTFPTRSCAHTALRVLYCCQLVAGSGSTFLHGCTRLLRGSHSVSSSRLPVCLLLVRYAHARIYVYCTQFYALVALHHRAVLYAVTHTAQLQVAGCYRLDVTAYAPHGSRALHGYLRCYDFTYLHVHAVYAARTRFRLRVYPSCLHTFYAPSEFYPDYSCSLPFFFFFPRYGCTTLQHCLRVYVSV